jgi:N-acetylglucosamine kinase-like BadF-type ATPase
MPLYIVADGGGTKTDIVLFDVNGKVLSRKKSGASNPIFMKLQDSLDNIRYPIEEMLKEQNLHIEDIQGTILFIPGMSKYEESVRACIHCRNIDILGDEMSAFYGALSGKSGIAVLSGTGSFAVGKNDRDEIQSVGGWGLLFGDQGSGYYMGIECLKAAAKLFDMGRENERLVSGVKEHFKFDDLIQLRKLQTDKEIFSREKISQLSFLVEKCARAGDRYSLKIIDDTAFELADLAYVCAARLDIKDKTYNCSLIGGISNMGSLITEPFEKHLKNLCPNLIYVKPEFKPIVGAMLYVMDHYGNKAVDPKTVNELSLQLNNY